MQLNAHKLSLTLKRQIILSSGHVNVIQTVDIHMIDNKTQLPTLVESKTYNVDTCTVYVKFLGVLVDSKLSEKFQIETDQSKGQSCIF